MTRKLPDAVECVVALTDPNVQAFLKMIRVGEGTTDEDGYRRHFGGELFESFADHPRRVVTKRLGTRMLSSTAAGAYQFLRDTWDGVAAALKLRDFSPRNQDIAAVYLVARRGALEDVIAGRVRIAIEKCAKEWASLPGSPYGQPTKTLTQALDLYAGYGGTTEPQKTSPAPDLTVAQAPIPQPETPMTTAADIINSPLTKFALAAVNPILAVVPEIAKLFMDKESGLSVPERNVAAAVKVVEMAREALTDAGIDAPNAQAVAEAVESDPKARQVVREAVMASYYELVESGGGGISGARTFINEHAEGAHGAVVWQIVKTVTYAAVSFLILANLMAFASWMTAVFREGNIGLETATQFMSQVITADIGAALTAFGFWLGSSWGSKRADERNRAPA